MSPTVTFRAPNDIDGDVHEVREEIMRALDEIAFLAEVYTEQAQRQLINCGLDRELLSGAEDDLLNSFIEARPKEHKLIEGLAVRGASFASYLRALRKAADQYDEAR